MGVFKLSTPLILAASLLSSIAQAAPAPRALKARDYVTEIVTETVWTTVDITTTVYVDELPSTSVPAETSAEVTSAEEVESTPVSTPTPAAISTPAPAVPAPAPASSEQASSEEAPVAASSAGEFAESSVPPVAESTAPAAPAPEYTAPVPSAPADTPPVPAPAAPTTYEAPAPSPEPVASPSPSLSPISKVSDNSGSCEAGASCTGDITHYDGGLGACGTTVDTKSEMAIALPHGFMGPLSNSNPMCGKSVTVKNPVSGTTVTGTVRDKCMGCVGRSIDLTDKMFEAVTDGKGDGRVHDIEWWFN